jgi:transcriptional regulator with XRE-family HTH domain
MSDILKLNKVLLEKKILQKDLARKIGVSRVTLSSWCNNKSLPSIETLMKVANILDVKISDLIND